MLILAGGTIAVLAKKRIVKGLHRDLFKPFALFPNSNNMCGLLKIILLSFSRSYTAPLQQ
ncbi:MAG: hypothetical protein RQM95_14985 [Syntrophaceticus schinkii]